MHVRYVVVLSLEIFHAFVNSQTGLGLYVYVEFFCHLPDSVTSALGAAISQCLAYFFLPPPPPFFLFFFRTF